MMLMLAKWTVRAGVPVALVTHRVADEVRAALDPALGAVLLHPAVRLRHLPKELLETRADIEARLQA